MRRVMSASRRVRKMGAVPVLGLTRAKSAGARGKQRSASLIAATPWRKKAQVVSSKRRSAPPKIRAQNLNEPCTSLKKILRFSKSKMAATRPVVETDWKKRAAVLSA